MYRKSVCLISLVFLLGLVSNALAPPPFVPGQRWWSDAGDSSLWSDPCNWYPYDGTVPGPDDIVYIGKGDPSTNYPLAMAAFEPIGHCLIDSGVTAQCYQMYISNGGSDTGGPRHLEMTGGSLAVKPLNSDWVGLVIGGISSGAGSMTVSGGDVEISGRSGEQAGQLVIGTWGGTGTLNMSDPCDTGGGTLTCYHLDCPEWDNNGAGVGHINLHGGTVYTTWDSEWTELWMGLAGEAQSSTIDVTGGQAIIKSHDENELQWLQIWRLEGKLTAYGGDPNYRVDITYNHNTAQTTVSARDTVAALAYGPPCFAGDLNSSYKVDLEDLRRFAEQWLDESGCSGPNCADFDDVNGVNMGDFAVLAEDWMDYKDWTTAGTNDVIVATPAAKICQLVGDWDNERSEATINLTDTRYSMHACDEGATFRHKGRTYIMFGETWGPVDENPIAYTTDTTPEDCLELTFLHDGNDPCGYGPYRPIQIPGVSMGAWEVPTGGASVNGKMYIYVTTDLLSGGPMGVCDRSVVAVSNDDGYNFTYLYDLSHYPDGHFMQICVVETELSSCDGLPDSNDGGAGLVIFGGGQYRLASLCLAYQPASQIEDPCSIRYFAGMGESNEPVWSPNESDAIELFDQPCIGEFSVTYNSFIKKWIMLYNCYFPKDEDRLRGINMRTADKPWGPWSEPKIVFHPWDDGGYCYFIHTDWNYMNCDSVHDPGREYEFGGEYGPYQFEELATGVQDVNTTIYFTMSTWNPYTVLLMKAAVQLD